LSLEELKAALKNARHLRSMEIRERYAEKKKQQQESDARELAQGNRGYLIKDGRSQYPQKVKIEVTPAS
jgi:hypothetical protein